MRFTYLLGIYLQVLLTEGLQIRQPQIPGTRPSISVYPKTLGNGRQLPCASKPRTKVCTVKGGTADDSDAILSAFKTCKKDGHVIFSAGTTYTVGKALDLRNLTNVDWGKFLKSSYRGWQYDGMR
jgi:hypothetical protein